MHAFMGVLTAVCGAGGSGRKSLARLATYVAEQRCFSIEISRNYRAGEFREDLKELYRQAGGQNRPTTFLFDETQIKYETFLEDINNILTSGEVPNLFGKDEIGGVVDEVRCGCGRPCCLLLLGLSTWLHGVVLAASAEFMLCCGAAACGCMCHVDTLSGDRLFLL